MTDSGPIGFAALCAIPLIVLLAYVLSQPDDPEPPDDDQYHS